MSASLPSAALSSAARAVIPVILSGGSGSRLWPMSREEYPKQFLDLTGQGSLLQETARRCRAAGLQDPIVVASQAHRFLVAEQMRALGLTLRALALEPVARNTAPAICAAAVVAAQERTDALLLVLPADHVILDEAAWAAAIDKAIPAAQAGSLVTFGITPDRPETGFGWIRRSTPLPEAAGVFKVEEFVEKPDLAKAQGFLDGGAHDWNSGMFLFRADILLAEMDAFEPQAAQAARHAVAESQRDIDFLRLDAAAFKAAPAISIDDAIFARTLRAAVVPCAIGWSDIGSWSALSDIAAKDEAGNAVIGDVILQSVSNSYVRTEGLLTAVVGLSDAVVVVTSDAVLVASKDKAQEVKTVVQRLKAQGRKEADSRPIHYRPWGYGMSIHAGDRYQVKLLSVKPGQQLSLQKHFHRAEHWVVVNGTALVTRDGEKILVRENESIYLPLGCVHRLENPGKIPLNLIEVQSGAYLGEDDIVRLEDAYGRI
jgi:mannose-1-phosphate guanylyltransferase / mannose-6-phosphate isomerase